MEKFIAILIFIHALSGGLALMLGSISMISKKGSLLHKRSGRWFFINMSLSSITALFVAIAPNHVNPFLFSIGVFTLYFLLSGMRAVDYKEKYRNIILDKLISGIMLLFSLGMIGLGILNLPSIHIVSLVFGILGTVFSIVDFIHFRDLSQLKANWLKFHIVKMSSAYISAVTAFLVVNNFFPPLVNWFGPGIVLGLFMAYWLIKIKSKKNKFQYN